MTKLAADLKDRESPECLAFGEISLIIPGSIAVMRKLTYHKMQYVMYALINKIAGNFALGVFPYVAVISCC